MHCHSYCLFHISPLVAGSCSFSSLWYGSHRPILSKFGILKVLGFPTITAACAVPSDTWLTTAGGLPSTSQGRSSSVSKIVLWFSSAVFWFSSMVFWFSRSDFYPFSFFCRGWTYCRTSFGICSSIVSMISYRSSVICSWCVCHRSANCSYCAAKCSCCWSALVLMAARCPRCCSTLIATSTSFSETCISGFVADLVSSTLKVFVSGSRPFFRTLMRRCRSCSLLLPTG